MIGLFLVMIVSAQAGDLPYGEKAPERTVTHDASTESTDKTMLERKVNAKGQLSEVIFFDYNVDPPQVERLTVQGTDRVRTTERGRMLLRRETERYDAKTGQLKSREVESCAEEGCPQLDRKTELDYSAGKVTLRLYERVDDRWKLKATSEQPSL